MSRIFLSHSSRDVREAVALKQWLAAQDPPLANEIFLDVDVVSGIRTGTRWKDALRRANARCEAVICLLSANWESSQECRVEYRTAENLNKQIFVVRLEPSTGDDLTSEWQRCDLFGSGPRTRVELDDGATVEFGTEGLYRLRDGIRGAGIGAESFVWPPPNDQGRAPYRGWEPLEEVDAAVFFGRDAQIIRALDAVRGMRLSGVSSLFVVLGPSGTGKSSFLRAGLLPRLRREDRRFVVCDIVRPERDALSGASGLAASVVGTRRQFGLHQPSLGAVKAACNAGDVATVAGWLQEVRQHAAAQLVERGDQDALMAPTLVLPLDQAEELFTADAGVRSDSFLRLLAGLFAQLNATESALVVAATIRTDRYEAMQTHPALAHVGTVLFDELKPMPATQFKEVIVGPAARSTEAGRALTVAPALVDRLLAEASEGADALPMLALTLARLHADYGGNGELTLTEYEAMGGMRRVVQTEIDEVLATDPGQRAGQLRALRSAFIPWLATVNPDNDQPMRRVARWDDLPPESRPLIDALVAKRLMVKDSRDGAIVVEVALESLLRQWDDLAGWLREERKELKDADDLERAAAAWTSSRFNPAWLLEGSRLGDATALVNKPGFRQRLTSVHPYLTASHQRETQRRAAEEEQRQSELRAAQERAQHAQERQATAEAHASTLRKRSRILRAVVAGTAVVAVLAVVASFIANNARGQAQHRFVEATGVRLVSEAQAMMTGTRPGGPIRAMQQLVAASALTGTPDRDAVYDAVVREAALSKVIITGDTLCPAAFSPDGKLVAAGRANLEGGAGDVRIWDVETGQQHGEVLAGHEDIINAVAFSPDGELLASASVDGTVRFWDVASGEQDGEPLEVGDSASAVFFSNDGIQVATLNWEGDLQVWDMKTRKPVGEPLIEGADRIAFTPDRSRVAAGDEQGNVNVVDMNSGNRLASIAREQSLTVLEFSPDGKQLMTAGPASPVEMWNADTGEPLPAPAVAGEHASTLVSASFSSDGSLIASGTTDSELKIWSAGDGGYVDVPLSGPAGVLLGVSFDPDGRRLAVTGADGTLWIFDVAMALPLQGRAVKFRGDGMLAVGGLDGTVQFWDPASREAMTAASPGSDAVVRMAFSPDGQTLASTTVDGMLQFRDPESGQLDGEPVDAGEFLGPVAFSADNRTVVTGAENGAVLLWDSETRRKQGGRLGGESGSTAAVAFDDGDVVTINSDNPESHLVAWNRETGEQVRDSTLSSGTLVGSIGPDATAGTGGLNGDVAFYNAETGEMLRDPVQGHRSFVTAMAFGPDGERAATGGGHSVRLWDARSGDTIGQALEGPRASVLDVALSPNGDYLAAGTVGGEVWIWPASAAPEDLCAKLTANMSRQQWSDWVSPDIDYIQACPDLPIPPD